MGDEEENEADTIRNKKMDQQKRLVEAKKAEEQLKTAMRVALEPAAYDRLMNVRIANQQLYFAAAQYAVTAYKKWGKPLTEQQLLNILHAIKGQEEKSATGIRFKRK